jgi:beta-mannanase
MICLKRVKATQLDPLPERGVGNLLRRCSHLGWSFALISLAAVTLSWAIGPVIWTERAHLGVYDPEKYFSETNNLSFEHIFLQWQVFDPSAYQSTVEYVVAHNRKLMVTVEPWTRAENWRDGGERLFADVTAGSFDSEIKQICSKIGTTSRPVLVRWGHEMEDLSGRYPWASRQPKSYIAAYRYFVDHCRTFAPEASYVWSPKGKPAAARYYPGNDYVDFVGLSLYALQAWDIDHFGRALNFNEVLQWSYSRVAGFNKPIIIAELGISGDADYKRQWLDDMSELKPKFDRLYAIIYFNSRETGTWPPPYGKPDWRIMPDDLGKSSSVN